MIDTGATLLLNTMKKHREASMSKRVVEERRRRYPVPAV
jgi:hypothetical protein